MPKHHLIVFGHRTCVTKSISFSRNGKPILLFGFAKAISLFFRHFPELSLQITIPFPKLSKDEREIPSKLSNIIPSLNEKNQQSPEQTFSLLLPYLEPRIPFFYLSFSLELNRLLHQGFSVFAAATLLFPDPVRERETLSLLLFFS